MLLIKNATVIDTNSKHHQKRRDILIRNGKIESIKAKIDAPKVKSLDASGGYVSIGWLDVGVHASDPGYEHRENLSTVSAAAAAGGYTGIACFPNTSPTIHSKSEVLYLKNNAKNNLVDLFPIGAISHNCEGKDLTEMYDMHQSGAVAFSDGRYSIQNSGMMMRALQYVKAFDGVVMNHPHDEGISDKGQLHEGRISTSLGMKGIPRLSEEIQLQRDIYLVEDVDSKLHASNISSANSQQLIHAAKKRGLNVTASVPLLNLIFTDEVLTDFNTQFKVFPPLRENSDVEALRKGIANGTIDIITSNHRPIEEEGKNLEFLFASFGALGLQTTYPLYNTYLTKVLDEVNFVDKVAIRPRQLFNLPIPQIAEGDTANLTIFHPEGEWTFTEKDILSKSKNSPIIGISLKGKILGVVNNGKMKVF